MKNKLGITLLWHVSVAQLKAKYHPGMIDRIARMAEEKMFKFPLDGSVITGSETVRAVQIEGFHVVYVVEPEQICLLMLMASLDLERTNR